MKVNPQELSSGVGGLAEGFLPSSVGWHEELMCGDFFLFTLFIYVHVGWSEMQFPAKL